MPSYQELLVHVVARRVHDLQAALMTWPKVSSNSIKYIAIKKYHQKVCNCLDNYLGL